MPTMVPIIANIMRIGAGLTTNCRMMNQQFADNLTVQDGNKNQSAKTLQETQFFTRDIYESLASYKNAKPQKNRAFNL